MLYKVSEDGIEYKYLETAGKVEFDDILYSSSVEDSDGFIFHHFFVKCSILQQKGLPLDANPREPTRARVVDEMAATLRDHPSMFHHWNNGMTVICDSVSHESDGKNHKIMLNFESGSGICNGGHTYFSIVTYPGDISDAALVHIEVIEIPSSLTGQERLYSINDIARNRNANRALLPTTEADFLGYYDIFKDSLKESSNKITWHEGDSEASGDAMNSQDFIRLIASLDPFWYRHKIHSASGSNHKAASSGGKAIHRKWFDGQDDPEQNLHHMAMIANEVLEIVDIISGSLKLDDFTDVSPRWRARNIYGWLASKSTSRRLILPLPALMMIVGCFRYNVWIAKDVDGYPIFIGFLIDNKELWDEGKIDLIKNLTSLFDDGDGDPNHFIKSNAPYDNQLLSLVYGNRLPVHPLYFYDLKDGSRYECDNDNPTHILKYSEEGYGELTEYSDSLCEEDSILYRKKE